jgi:hypothetical protein
MSVRAARAPETRNFSFRDGHGSASQRAGKSWPRRAAFGSQGVGCVLHQGSGARNAGASTAPAGLQTPAAAAGACTRRSQLDHPTLGLAQLGGIAAGETAAHGTPDGGRRAVKKDYAQLARGR